MRRILKDISLLLIIFAMTGAIASAQASEFKIIVNKSNAASSISKAQLSKMFLKKVSKWDDSKKVLPIDQKTDSPVREAFSEAIHEKGIATVQAYWHHKIFSGRGTPPKVEASDASVIEFIKSNPGAIGYVSAEAVVDDVKVIEVSE